MVQKNIFSFSYNSCADLIWGHEPKFCGQGGLRAEYNIIELILNT